MESVLKSCCLLCLNKAAKMSIVYFSAVVVCFVFSDYMNFAFL